MQVLCLEDVKKPLLSQISNTELEKCQTREQNQWHATKRIQWIINDRSGSSIQYRSKQECRRMGKLEVQSQAVVVTEIRCV